jgi:hypothetical protein
VCDCHGLQPGKGWRALIKWKGYAEDMNSWEPAPLMPRALVEKFRRENNLPEDIISPAAAGVEMNAAPSSSTTDSSSSNGKADAASSKEPQEKPAGKGAVEKGKDDGTKVSRKSVGG